MPRSPFGEFMTIRHGRGVGRFVIMQDSEETWDGGAVAQTCTEWGVGVEWGRVGVLFLWLASNHAAQTQPREDCDDDDDDDGGDDDDDGDDGDDDGDDDDDDDDGDDYDDDDDDADDDGTH